MSGGLGIDGLVSGLDTGSIIQSLLAMKERPIANIQERIDDVSNRKRAILDLNSRLLNFQEVSRRIRFPTQFNRAAVRSSNESVLLATGDTSAITGAFSFVAKQQAASSQFVSNGFKDADTTPISATGGNVTIEVGDARLARKTNLSDLRGGEGFDRGSIRIVDDSGNTAVVDLSSAITLQEVVDKINNNGVANVTAKIDDTAINSTFGAGLIVQNSSLAGNLTITDVGGDLTANSLGIAKTTAGGTVTGDSLNYITTSSPLSMLNDGRGINGGADPLSLDIVGSIIINVPLTDSKTVGDVIDKINTAGGGTITASISSTGRGITLTDTGTPATMLVSSTLSTTTAEDLGLIVGVISDAGGGVFDGRDTLASFGSVLSQSLHGSAGGGLTGTVATPSTFTITDSNAGVTTISLTGREDLANIIAQINQPTVGIALVSARINANGNGIEIVDTAGGAGSLTIADTVGTAAAQFGVDGAFATGKAEGGNANLQHLYRQKSLTAMNGGKGVSDGNIRVKLSDGTEASISTLTSKTVGDILDRLNAVTGLTASINTFGDGFLLTDSTAGSGSMIIEDLSGTVAEGLNLTGTFTTATVDQRFEFDVAVGTTDTLNEVMLAVIDQTDFVTIHTFGDGGNINPARMAIGARTSGEHGTVMISSTVAELQFNQTSEARDSILLFGSAEGAGEPQVVRSRDGKFNVLSGVTLDVIGASDERITITVDRDLQSVANDITELVDGFNSAQDRIDEQTSFDPETFAVGPLHGDGIILSLENELRRLMIDPVDGLNSATNNLTSVGIRFNSTGNLTLDADQLLEALTDRFDQVVDLFTHSANVTANTPIAQYNNGLGIRTDTGNDIRINFQDGTFFEVDLDGIVDTADMLSRFNADSRITASVGANNRRLEFTDNTTGTETFAFADLNNSGTVASMAIISPTDGDGDGDIVTQNLIIADELGVSRRLDLGLERYVSPFDGLFKELENSADQQIERYNKDISRIQGQVDLERERLQRQFTAMESFLAESQNIQATLAGQLQAITAP